jgi:hypothetical protein
MRTSSALVLLLSLAACEQEPAAPPSATAEAPDDSLIECALRGAAEFERDCAVEQVRSDDQLVLVVRHPDGGFRRFDVLTDGRGLAAADGAQTAQVALREGGIEVTVGADRYRFPATFTNAVG